MNAEDRDIVMRRFQSNQAESQTSRGISALLANPPTTDLNPLAYRKKRSRYCQLCFKKAYFTCRTCRQANYCCKEHRKTDMKDFHLLVCEHMAYIGAIPPFFIFKEERDNYRQSVVIKIKELLSIAESKAKESLLRNDPTHAVSRSSYIHRYSPMLFRKTDPRHIQPVLINAEALALQGKLSEARRMLTKAEIILIMNKGRDTQNAEYYRTEGVINTLEQDYLQALNSFADEVYWATEANHSEHPRVARGYFNMGSMFLKFNRKRTAFSYFKHSVDIWLVRLQEVLQVALAIHEATNPLGATQREIDLTEEESLLMSQSMTLLLDILPNNTTELAKQQLIEVYYALALLHYLKSKFHKARILVDKACELISEDSGTGTLGSLDTSSTPDPVEDTENNVPETKKSSTLSQPGGVRFMTRWDRDLTAQESVRWMDKLKQLRKYCRRHSL